MVAQKQTPRLQALYRDEIGPKLLKEFGLKNPHQLPKLSKIIVNVGVGKQLVLAAPSRFSRVPHETCDGVS